MSLALYHPNIIRMYQQPTASGCIPKLHSVQQPHEIPNWRPVNNGATPSCVRVILGDNLPKSNLISYCVMPGGYGVNCAAISPLTVYSVCQPSRVCASVSNASVSLADSRGSVATSGESIIDTKFAIARSVIPLPSNWSRRLIAHSVVRLSRIASDRNREAIGRDLTCPKSNVVIGIFKIDADRY